MPRPPEPRSKTCVIVSPYFPPSTLAGVHRARHLAKHLPSAGWKPIVLCVDEAHHEERLDPALARLVPATTEVVKVPAISARITRPLGVGEISLRGMIPLRKRLFELLATRPVDAVLITGSPYYPMLMSSAIRRRFGVPVVLDFQDPWVSAWGAAQARWSKPGLSHWLATVLEPRALHGASFVTSISDAQNDQLAARHPWLDRERMAAIPIGSDPEDFDALANGSADTYALESGCIHLSYVGTVWPPVIPTLRVVLRAIAALRDGHPDLYARLRFNFVGTTANPNDSHGFRVTPLAQAAGVASAVREEPRRIPYLEALSIMRRSHANLMIGSGETHYSASKVYPCLMSGRPYLSVFHRASRAHQVLAAAGGGVALAFSSDAELAALEGAICEGLRRVAAEPLSLGRANPAACTADEARHIAGRYAEIFDRLARERVGAPACG